MGYSIVSQTPQTCKHFHAPKMVTTWFPASGLCHSHGPQQTGPGGEQMASTDRFVLQWHRHMWTWAWRHGHTCVSNMINNWFLCQKRFFSVGGESWLSFPCNEMDSAKHSSYNFIIPWPLHTHTHTHTHTYTHTQRTISHSPFSPLGVRLPNPRMASQNPKEVTEAPSQIRHPGHNA
jgi:hypothetical protein